MNVGQLEDQQLWFHFFQSIFELSPEWEAGECYVFVLEMRHYTSLLLFHQHLTVFQFLNNKRQDNPNQVIPESSWATKISLSLEKPFFRRLNPLLSFHVLSLNYRRFGFAGHVGIQSSIVQSFEHFEHIETFSSFQF